MKKDSRIGFKLAGITTEQFAILEENYKETHSPEFEFGLEYKINKKDKLLGCFTSFTFAIDKMPFLKIETSCSFKILDKPWESFLAESEVIIPAGFIKHITAITVSSARGVLHAKTESTIFNKFFIPLINIDSLIKENVTFNVVE